jgi:hypothetical protein
VESRATLGLGQVDHALFCSSLPGCHPPRLWSGCSSANEREAGNWCCEGLKLLQQVEMVQRPQHHTQGTQGLRNQPQLRWPLFQV